MAQSQKKCKIGLALGSGAARGLAHVGVLKVLERNNIPIDFISGSSIGAVVGAMYAVTRNISELEKIITTADWRLFLSLIDPITPGALIKGEKIKKFLAHYLGEATFDDLKIPLVIAATDFQTGEPILVTKGDLLQAIMASSAIPMVFKQVKMNDRTLADGGLSMPIPIGPLKKMGADKVIAVNLDGDYFSKNKSSFSLGEMAMQMIKMLRFHLSERDAAMADVVVVPEVGQVMGYSFNIGQKAIDAGEKAAQKALPQIKKLLA